MRRNEVFMQTTLPITNENGYFEIRLESIGGLGANLCGKMLGELGALFLDLNASSFSSYGSEKRGSPVKAFIRWCGGDKPVRINSPVVSPHILAIFHEGLLSTYPVLDGVTQDTRIVLATSLSEKEAKARYHITAGTLFCLDALKIAMETKSRINMVMLGAIVGISGFVPLDVAETLCRDTIGKKYPALIDANLAGVRQGFHAASETAEQAASDEKAPGCASQADSSRTSPEEDIAAQSDTRQEQYFWGYENAPIGGINPRIGSTVSNNLSPSREGYVPLFLQERCINCGLCASTCPDQVFQFSPGIYKGQETMVNNGLDYYHCKGCMRCVEICPTNALVEALEAEQKELLHFLPNQDLLPDSIQYEKTGANSWITSESFLDEKRMDGGVS